jgi:hypothetical protein
VKSKATSTQTSRGTRAQRRRQRFLARRHVPPERGAPFDVRGQAGRPDPQAGLVADLQGLIEAGLVVPIAHGDEVRYARADDDGTRDGTGVIVPITVDSTIGDIKILGPEHTLEGDADAVTECQVLDLFAGSGTIAGGAR